MKSRTYTQWVSDVDGRDKKSLIPRAQLRLDRIQAVLNILGNPQWFYRTVHVGGTAGKGSTCTFLASIFQVAGLRTALTLSPYIKTVREKMQVNGRNIKQIQFVRVAGKIAQAERRACVRLSHFEFLLAMAFEYFRDQRVDVAVVEVGVGGRYDATNVLKPSAVILTNVGRDHMDLLGGTPLAILKEKMGILKPKTPLVTGVFRESQEQKISAHVRRLGIPWMRMNGDF